MQTIRQAHRSVQEAVRFGENEMLAIKRANNGATALGAEVYREIIACICHSG